MSNNIDKIIYINLERRRDRKEQIEAELDRFNLSYERFNAIDYSSIVGCSKSHLEVLRLAKIRGYKNILILEDDFIFLVSKETFEQELDMFFKSGLDFDVCMISYSLLEDEEVPNFNHVRRVLNARTASGYIVNQSYYDKLIEIYEWAIPLLEQTGSHWLYANDTSWEPLQRRDKWYYFINRIGKQKEGWSDNSNCFMKYDC